MIRAFIIALIATGLTFISCGHRKNVNLDDKTLVNKITVDTTLIAILPYDSSLYGFGKDCNQIELTTNDLAIIETLLKKCIDEYNPEKEKEFNEVNSSHPEYNYSKMNFVIDLKRYKRQYIPMINNSGEKVVWINCFCNTWDKNWKNDLIIVMDGGNCYFNLKINLTTGKYYDLMVNGEA